MTRQYANIFCSIWDDADFCALPSDAQRSYFMLVTQKEITACGSLPLTLRRWAKTLPAEDRDTLEPSLKVLADHGFVLVDEDTEELLVRTFPKHDGGYKHAKRVLAVIAYAEAIRSQPLRNAVAIELAKLGVKTAIGLPIDSQSVANAEAIDSLRSVVTYVSTDHTPQTESTILNQGTESGSQPQHDGNRGPRPKPHCKRHPNGTDDPCVPCRDAKAAVAAWDAETDRLAKVAAAEQRRADNRARLQQIERCQLCDQHGYRLLPDGGTGGPCDHEYRQPGAKDRALAAVAATTKENRND